MTHLTKEELNRLLEEARKGSERDYLMFLLSVNHGLRASEVTSVCGTNIRDGFLDIQRLKGSLHTIQPLWPNEKEGIEKLAKEVGTGRLFPISRVWFWVLMQRYCERAGIPKHKAHPHVLKHTMCKLSLAAGIKLDDLKQYAGHKSIASTGAYLKTDDEEASKAFAIAMGMIK